MRFGFDTVKTSLFLLASLLIPLAAQAGAFIGVTGGSGPNGYRFSEASGYADLFSSKFSLNAMGMKSSADHSEDVTQSSFGLNWKASNLIKLGIKHNNVDNGTIDVRGNGLSLGLNLNTQWDSDLYTRLDISGTSSAYKFGQLPSSIQNNTVSQSEASISLTQDINDNWSFFLGHDQYNYDRSIKDSIFFLLQKYRWRFLSSPLGSSLLSFPEESYRSGLTWRATESLTFDFSALRSYTLVGQTVINRRLGLDYQFTERFNLGMAVSRTTATQIVTKQDFTYIVSTKPLQTLTIPKGTEVIPEGNDTYSELSLGWTF